MADPETQRVFVTLYVGRFDSRCGACGKGCWAQEKAHTSRTGYDQHEGCGAVYTHVVSTYAGDDMEKATRALRPDLIYGLPSAWADAEGMWAT